ncbi:MAG: ATP-binding cassette domain-containing protein [Nitrospirae bacterium]|nr:ATP-binding cassette domain-containing protein [Nitrospirota bacterium]
MNHIEICNIEKSFVEEGKAIPVLSGLSLAIEKGEFFTLFGPNGCGKTTLMNILAGVGLPDKGEIRLNSESHNSFVSYVFQDFMGSLIPWKNVEKNIAFPLKLRGIGKAERKRRTEEIFDKFDVKLSPKAKIYSLSGGQAQMVSLLRALIVNPEVLILDEPFSALDYKTRLFMMETIQKIWHTAGVTIIFISHDIDDAIYLGDHLVILSERPARVKGSLEIPFERPRDFNLFGRPEFASYKKEALEIFLSL